MNVQGYQKLTLLDYPGHVAATLFLGGCNLRCPFCHNAGLVRTPTAEQNAEDEVLRYLAGRRGILDGVCVTGGEPLLHPDLPELLQKIKALGYLIKLDTNGSLPRRLEAVLATGLVDMVAMDLKHAPDHYPDATGCDLPFAPFAESMDILRHSGLPFEFRTTVVRGIHEKADILAIAALVGDAPYYLQKFVDSGNLLGEGNAPFTDTEMQDMLIAARTLAPRTALRGCSTETK
jgi:pyruvate formate lyase activating enzyme